MAAGGARARRPAAIGRCTVAAVKAMSAAGLDITAAIQPDGPTTIPASGWFARRHPRGLVARPVEANPGSARDPRQGVTTHPTGLSERTTAVCRNRPPSPPKRLSRQASSEASRSLYTELDMTCPLAASRGVPAVARPGQKMQAAYEVFLAAEDQRHLVVPVPRDGTRQFG